MKTYLIRTVLIAAWIFAAFSCFSQTTENFNSRGSIPVSQVKSYLQNNCWQFPGFVTGSNPAIEGDGSLIQDAAHQQAGIYTPVLNLQATTSVSFKYSFQANAAHSGWIRLCITNATNQIIKVTDSTEIKNTSANIVYTYNKTVSTQAGVYKIFIQYTDAAGTAPVTIDQLQISASQYYATGCNQAPVAVSDAFSGGSTSSVVTGNVLQNDRDADGDALSAYLISGSTDGTVNLLSNGSFTFIPRGGFNGSSTSFMYKVCDNGYSSLCSSNAMVTLFFSPGNIVPVRYAEFSAAYHNNEVLLNWVTAYENSTENFDVERSRDSLVFRKLATVKGYGTLGSINSYKYSDTQSPETDLLKVLYYRLKSVDADKKVVYSPVLKVRIEGVTGLKSLKVSPNPVVNDMAVQLQLNRSCSVTFKVFNSSGHVVYNQPLQGEAGTNYITLTGTSLLNKGLYFVQVMIDKNEKLISKIIKN